MKLFNSIMVATLTIFFGLSAQAQRLSSSELSTIQTIATFGNPLTLATVESLAPFFKVVPCQELSNRVFSWNGVRYYVRQTSYAQVNDGTRIISQLHFNGVFGNGFAGQNFQINTGVLKNPANGYQSDLFADLMKCANPRSGGESMLIKELADRMGF